MLSQLSFATNPVKIGVFWEKKTTLRCDPLLQRIWALKLGHWNAITAFICNYPVKIGVLWKKIAHRARSGLFGFTLFCCDAMPQSYSRFWTIFFIIQSKLGIQWAMSRKWSDLRNFCFSGIYAKFSFVSEQVSELYDAMPQSYSRFWTIFFIIQSNLGSVLIAAGRLGVFLAMKNI